MKMNGTNTTNAKYNMSTIENKILKVYFIPYVYLHFYNYICHLLMILIPEDFMPFTCY